MEAAFVAFLFFFFLHHAALAARLATTSPFGQGRSCGQDTNSRASASKQLLSTVHSLLHSWSTRCSTHPSARAAMDFELRCNDLKCRTKLHDRAVVTTCRSAACPDASQILGHSHPLQPRLLHTMCRHHRLIQIFKRQSVLPGLQRLAPQPRRRGHRRAQPFRRLQDKRSLRTQSCCYYGVC